MIDTKIESVNERLEIPPLVSDSDPILHRKLKPFDYNGDMDAGWLADTLFNAMDLYKGVGLSASQIGIDARVFVLGYRGGIKIEVFNPKVLDITGKEIMMYEGCLSYPGINISVKRPGSIFVSYQDRYGEYRQDMFSGMTARIFLHEYDHMEGITFKDRVSKFKWDFWTSKIKKKRK